MKRTVSVLVILMTVLFVFTRQMEAVPETAERAASVPPGPAADDIVTDATKNLIEITVRYSGDRIDFFGSMEGTNADAVVVKLTSPAETVKLNIKGRVGPFWMNVKQYNVDNVSSMFQIHASDTLENIASPELIEELLLSFEAVKNQLKLHILKGEEEAGDFEKIFSGLVQLKRKADLYVIDDAGTVEIKDGKLFNHYFQFPTTAKPGIYSVETFLIKNKKLVGRSVDEIEIKKVGLEAFVFAAANEHPVLYGLFAVLIALFTGLVVGFIFKGAAH